MVALALLFKPSTTPLVIGVEARRRNLYRKPLLDAANLSHLDNLWLGRPSTIP